MERANKLGIALIIIFLLGFFLWAVMPKDDFNSKIFKEILEQKDQADIVFKDATLAEIYDGIKYWELISKSSAINKSFGRADMNDVDGLFFDNGKPTIKFLAPSAIWYMKKNEISLNEPIGYDVKYDKTIRAELAKVKDIQHIYSVFHLPDKNTGKAYKGYWFQAKKLNWRLATKKLICSGNILLTKDNVVINAGKLEADVGMEKVMLTERPSAEIASNGDKIMITAKEIYVDSFSDIIMAKDKVTLTKGTATISTSKLLYDQKNDFVEMTGNVYVSDKYITAFSNVASYDIKNNKVSLVGKAKAKRENNEIFGDKMTIFLGQNKIIVEGKTKATIKETEVE